MRPTSLACHGRRHNLSIINGDMDLTAGNCQVTLQLKLSKNSSCVRCGAARSSSEAVGGTALGAAAPPEFGSLREDVHEPLRPHPDPTTPASRTAPSRH